MIDLSNFDSEELLALANLEIRSENYTAALCKLKVIKGRNEIPLGYFSAIGRVYASLGLLNRAKSAFVTFVEQTPEAFHEKFQLGMVEFEMGNLSEAQKIWGELVENHPLYSPALFYKAVIHLQNEELSEAKECLAAITENCGPQDEYYSRAQEQLSRINIQ